MNLDAYRCLNFDDEQAGPKFFLFVFCIVIINTLNTREENLTMDIAIVSVFIFCPLMNASIHSKVQNDWEKRAD